MARLDDAYRHASTVFADLPVARERFEAWAAKTDELSDERAEELYLCAACVDGSSLAIAAFERRYFGALASTFRRFGDDSFVEDASQELRQRLFFGVDGRPKLLEFGGRGGLQQWVRAVATRVALNLRRSRHDERYVAATGEDDALLELPFHGDDPELAHFKSTYREAFKRAFAEAIEGLSAEARNHLRLYYVDGLTVTELGTLFGTSAPTVSRRLSTARTEVLAATRVRLGERLKLTPTELESVLRLIESKLSVDLRKV